MQGHSKEDPNKDKMEEEDLICQTSNAQIVMHTDIRSIIVINRVADKETAKAVRRQQREERINLLNAEFVNRGMGHLQRPVFGQ